MKSNAFITTAGLITLFAFFWVITGIMNTAPKYKCIDGFVYENYMTGDVWTKTKKECVEIK